jgi:dipeptidyl aminopeptidase/acylaminoacyl peptidase
MGERAIRGALALRRCVPQHWRGASLALLAVLLVACGQPTAIAKPTPVGVAAPPVAAEVATAAAPPSTGRLLFVRSGNIWLWQDGQDTQLTTTGNIRQPRWSPAGDAILYIQVGESYMNLMLADANGQSPRALTDNQAKGYQIESADYVRLSFLLTGPTWARLADGSDRIVYSTDREGGAFNLAMMSGLGAKAVPVNPTKALGVHIEGAALAPDGATIAFVAPVTDAASGATETQLYTVIPATGVYKAITAEKKGAYDPAWSADGQWIVYSARADKADETDLFIMHPDGSGRQRLTDGGKDRGASWSPDGTQIAFLRQQDTGFALYTIDLDSSTGTIAAGKPQRLGDFVDAEGISGTSWTR